MPEPERKSYLLGVTGAVGAGKSTVCGVLRGWGWSVLDVDDVAAASLMDAGAELATLCPAAVRPGGAQQIDKGALIAAILRDAATRAAVEAALRPHVLRRVRAWAEALTGPGALEAALLFEASLDPLCAGTLCVRCPQDERRRRTAARETASARHFDEMEATQLPEEEKARVAGASVWSDGDHATMERSLREALCALGAPCPPVPGDPELEALRRHVADLEEAVAERRRSVERLAETEQRFRRILEATHDALVVFREGLMVQVNQRCVEMFRCDSPDDLLGKSPFEFCTPEAIPIVRHRMQTGNEAPYEVFVKRRDGSTFLAEIQGRSTSYQGHPARVSVFRDVTEREQVEEALHAAFRQKEVIRAHEAVLAQLSTPLLPIGNATVVLPLIGAVNAERAAQVVQTLVEGVAHHRARTAILDITGVPDVDAHVADALLQAARAVRLLGARVVLTGIRPEVAHRFVLLGADLSGIVTYGTLERGIKSSLGRDSARELR